MIRSSHRGTLARHPVVGQLDAGPLARLDDAMESRQLVRGQTVFEAGAPSPGIFLVLSGYIKLLKNQPEGRELLVGLAGADQFFGPCCLPLNDCPSPCTARAAILSRLLVLPTTTWKRFFTSDPEIAHALLEAMMSTRRTCIDQATDMVFLDVKARLAKLLVRLSEKTRPGPRGELSVPRVLSHWELATAVGSVREVITRKIQELVEEDILGRTGRQIVIRDIESLRKVAATGPT